MDEIVLVVIVVLAAVLVMPVVALAKAFKFGRVAEDLRARVAALEQEVRMLRRSAGRVEAPKPEPEPEQVKAEERPIAQPPVFQEPAWRAPATTPPPLHPAPQPIPEPVRAAARRYERAATPPEVPTEQEPAPTETEPASTLGWEQFMGARLFAWIGGLSLFLGIAFFVKYSFEHNLIPPQVRVAIGFVAGLALIAGGRLIRRKENAVTAQTLCATGILVLYAVTFACRSYYHFPFFGVIQTFVIMSLITCAAFVLAVGMDAMVIAILGIAGGFLTPVLLSTGQDNPLGLFSYIAFLDIGLLAIARRKVWNALPPLGAIGTVLMEGAWIGAFFEDGHYAFGNKIFIVMAVLAGFQALFLAAAGRARREDGERSAAGGAALLVGAVALVGAFYFLAFEPLGHRPILICSYLFVVDLGLIALSLVEGYAGFIRSIAGLAAYLFLGAWTQTYLTNAYLNAALGCYFVFALLHSILPILLERRQKSAGSAWAHVFPACSLLLVLLPIFEFHDVSLVIWPFVLLVDVLAFIVAMATLTLAPVLLVLVLTLVAIGGSLLDVPVALTGLPTDLFLLGGFAILFMVGSAWAARRLAPEDAAQPELFGSLDDPANLAVQIPSLSAALPFLLLIMVIVRLPLHDPGSVFGLGMLFAVLLLGVATFFSIEALPVVGLISSLALEHAWLLSPYCQQQPLVALRWYGAFYGLFTLFPFLFRARFADKKYAWAAAALAGPLHFYLAHELTRAAFPDMAPGLLPALLAVPPLLGLAILAKMHAPANPARKTQLALFGGVALFFITLIFPFQFHREWITISWALEGSALCWLFRRVPHPGLRLTGVALLAIAFARLGLNPMILSYHIRTAHPILNWYLYAFGVVSLALYAGARLLAPPRNKIGEIDAPPFLFGMTSFLAFVLVNIEIADYFSAPGTEVLTFEFSGDFARDMTYSIAWALFALILLIIGIRRRNAPIRYAGLGLLSITVLKLFLNDLWELDQLYRIAAFIAVAVIAILASFLYQRFFALPRQAAQR
jgi:uncharacterized membrane protein